MSKDCKDNRGWEERFDDISDLKEQTYGVWKSVDGNLPIIKYIEFKSPLKKTRK